MTIFISIAAYRDPELVPTIRDCLLARASRRSAFRHLLAARRQRSLTAGFRGSAHARARRALARKSRRLLGALGDHEIWASEDWFLQLDSHHRFVQDWDALLLAHAERSGATRPMLTTYAAPFDPDDAERRHGEPMQMDFDQFTAEGIPAVPPAGDPGLATLQRPLRARFVSARFLFTLGSFVNDVPYDPELYFHRRGDHAGDPCVHPRLRPVPPPDHILWHEYTRLIARSTGETIAGAGRRGRMARARCEKP